MQKYLFSIVYNCGGFENNYCFFIITFIYEWIFVIVTIGTFNKEMKMVEALRSDETLGCVNNISL